MSIAIWSCIDEKTLVAVIYWEQVQLESCESWDSLVLGLGADLAREGGKQYIAKALKHRRPRPQVIAIYTKLIKIPCSQW